MFYCICAFIRNNYCKDLHIIIQKWERSQNYQVSPWFEKQFFNFLVFGFSSLPKIQS